MTLSPAVIDAVVACGCTIEQLAAIVKADLQERARAGSGPRPTSMSGAERTALWRARRAAGVALAGAGESASRDETSHFVTERHISSPDLDAPASQPAENAGITTVPAPVTPPSRDPDSGVRVVRPRDQDLARARAALARARELPPASRLVGAVILDHYNRDTGRCDPSVERIGRISGLHERSIRRAAALLDELGLIARRVHGGRRHRNAFAPDFAAIIALDASTAFESGSVTTVTTRTLWSADPDSRVPHNLNLEPESDSEVVAGTAREPRTAPVRPAPRGAGSGGSRQQRELLLPIDGGRRQIAETAASNRLWRDLRQRYFGTAGWGGIVDAMLVDDLVEAAQAAEMRRPGVGITVVETALRRSGLDPPGKVGAG